MKDLDAGPNLVENLVAESSVDHDPCQIIICSRLCQRVFYDPSDG